MLIIGYSNSFKKWYCYRDDWGEYYHKNKRWTYSCGPTGFWKSLDSLVSLLKKENVLNEGTKVQFVTRS